MWHTLLKHSILWENIVSGSSKLLTHNWETLQLPTALIISSPRESVMGIAQLWVCAHHGLIYHALRSLIGTYYLTMSINTKTTHTHTKICLETSHLCSSPQGKCSLPLPLTARHQRLSLWVYTVNNSKSFYTQYTQRVCTSKFTNFHSEHRTAIYYRTAMALFRYLAQMRSDLMLRRYGKVISPQPLSITQMCEPKL